jgi:antitoxin ParD1/3/4
MATQQTKYQTWLEETRTKIKVGIEARDRGDVIDGETFLAELQQKIEQRKPNQHDKTHILINH